MTLWRLVGLIPLSLVLLLAALIGFAPTWLRLGLSLYGADDITFQSLDIGLNRSELSDLEIGNPATQMIDRISLDYTLSEIVGGHVDRITVDGLNAKMALDDLVASESEQTPLIMPAGTFVKELVLEKSRIDVRTPAGLISIPLAGHIKTLDDHLAFELLAEGANLDGADRGLLADFTLGGTFALDDAPALDDLTASGELSVQANNASVQGLADELEGQGLITFELENGKLNASIDHSSMKVAGLPFDAGPLKTPWLATLGAADDPLLLTGRMEDGNWRIAIAGPLGLKASTATVMADLDLGGILGEDGHLQSLDKGHFSLDLSEVSWKGADLRKGKALLTVSGTEDALQGRLTLEAEGFSWSDASYTISEATLQQELDLAFDGKVLDLSVAEKGRISIDEIAAVDHGESGWFTVRLYPNEAPLLSFNRDDASWRSQLAVEIDPVRLETPSGQWWARIENLGIAATGNSDGPTDSRIIVKQGRVDLPSANLALIGIESDVQFAGNDSPADQAVPIIIRAIRPLNEPRWFTPLRLDVTVELSPSELPFSGWLTTRKKPGARIDFSGTQHVESGEGAIAFDLAELMFSPDGLQPADLSPELQNVLSDTFGKVALAGKMAWGRNGNVGTADLLIEELGLSIGPAKLERVNALLRFDSLAPLTMSAGQELAIGLLDVGLPLTDGLVSMKLNADGALGVDQLTWRLAEGEVRASPFTFGSDVQALTMMLDVDQLDLNELLRLTELDGLSGEGLIDGTLPLTISESGVMIADGKLEATGAGVLRYRPGQKPGVLQAGGESVGLMLRALENFRYDELKITLDGRTDGETNIGLHVSGANPDLYEGHPIEFNLDLEGDLANLVRTNLSNYQIPDRIREQLQGFGK